MTVAYWYMFPVAVAIATTAMASPLFILVAAITLGESFYDSDHNL